MIASGPVFRRAARRLLIAGAFLFACLIAAPALAQSRVQVNEDRTTIWRPGFSVAADVVDAGTILNVVAKTGNWYEVELPRRPGSDPIYGFVEISRVTALDQNPMRRPDRPLRPQAQRQARRARDLNPFDNLPFTIRLFGQAGYGQTAAAESFDAVLGGAGGVWWGGGLQIPMKRNGLFFELAAERTDRTGERVFVFEGEVIPLGVEDKVRIVPVTASVGYRFFRGRNRAAYIAAGAGRALYTERSPDGDDVESVDTAFAHYQFVGGFEFGAWKALHFGLEGQYSRTPISEHGGLAEAFGEDDLGGVQVRLKLLLGR
jgi:hypothetical protein